MPKTHSKSRWRTMDVRRGGGRVNGHAGSGWRQMQMHMYTLPPAFQPSRTRVLLPVPVPVPFRFALPRSSLPSPTPTPHSGETSACSHPAMLPSRHGCNRARLLNVVSRTALLCCDVHCTLPSNLMFSLGFWTSRATASKFGLLIVQHVLAIARPTQHPDVRPKA